jgi:predicted nucleic acid-binding protein
LLDRSGRNSGETNPTIIVDTGVLYAFADRDDERHLDAKAILLRILRGDFGSPIVVDYVVLETQLLLSSRKLSHVMQELMEFLRSNSFRMLFVTEEIFNAAIDLIVEKKQDSISLADSSEIVLSRMLHFNAIATFDSVLSSFFDKKVGKGFYDQLEEKEKSALLKARGMSSKTLKSL